MPNKIRSYRIKSDSRPARLISEYFTYFLESFVILTSADCRKFTEVENKCTKPFVCRSEISRAPTFVIIRHMVINPFLRSFESYFCLPICLEEYIMLETESMGLQTVCCLLNLSDLGLIMNMLRGLMYPLLFYFENAKIRT